MKEHHKRSIVKTITWRIIASLTTAGIILLFTHQWALSLSIGGIDGFLKLVFYYFHERAWINIKWGSVPIDTKA